MIRDFIQAARLRTLPLASACVLTGGALAAAAGTEQARFTPWLAGWLLTVGLLHALAAANAGARVAVFERRRPGPKLYARRVWFDLEPPARRLLASLRGPSLCMASNAQVEALAEAVASEREEANPLHFTCHFFTFLQQIITRYVQFR